MTMNVGDKNVSFKWSNYTKPTPANLERITSGIKDLLSGMSAISIVSEQYTLSLCMSICGVVLGQVIKFFASIAQEERNNQPPA
jgi:hypothetical protein